MQYRTLGKDLTVSAVELGCMGMSHAYGTSEIKLTKQEIEILDKQLDMIEMSDVFGGTNI